MQEQNLYTQEEIDLAVNQSIDFFKQIPKIDMGRMEYQIEIAKRILHSYYIKGTKNIVIEAPTGFGKSILAFFLTMSVKNLIQDDTPSYILTSSKFLQEQYNRDVDLFKLDPTYSLLKGQGNYICNSNGEPFFKRECTGIGLTKVEKEPEFKECSATCQYLIKRKQAMIADTTIFNYAYWLTTMNRVYSLLGPDNAPFIPRELTIFDESHLVGDLVQNMFSNEINIDRTVRMSENLYKMLAFTHPGAPDISDDLIILKKKVYEMDAIQNLNDFEAQYNSIIEFIKVIGSIKNAFNMIKGKLLKKSPEGEKPKLGDDEKRFVNFAEGLTELIDSLNALTTIYKESGLDSIVMTVEEQRRLGGKSKNDTDLVLKLQCTDEVKLIQEKLIKFTNKGLYMSATIGDIDNYCKQMGIEDYEKIYIDSDFDFSKSRIYTVTPKLKMSYKFKHENMPKMINYIKTILEHHKDERGIIHTGNFEFMNRIKDDIYDERLIIYSNSSEKEAAMEKLKETPNGVLCGPSILEGVDLKDDLARFMIFMKVPYKSLADKLTKRKMDKYPGWYDWLTMTSFLQGLGRPIRHKKDYATTYLLDGSFDWFLSKNRLRQYQQDRMHTCSITKLGTSHEDEFQKELDNLDLFD